MLKPFSLELCESLLWTGEKRWDEGVRIASFVIIITNYLREKMDRFPSVA